MRYCEKCGSEIPDGRKFCSNCGATLENANPFEEILQKPTIEKSRDIKESSKSRLICIILLVVPLVWVMVFSTMGVSLDNTLFSNISAFGALFLGVHQFYVGKIKMGILFTLTVGCFLIGAIIVLIKLTITKTFVDGDGLPVI